MSSSSYKYKYSSTVFLWLYVKGYYISCHLLLHSIFLTLWFSCLCPQTSNSGWFYSQHACSCLDTWRSGLIFLHMPSDSVFSTCPCHCLGFWHTVMALGPHLRKPGKHTGRDFCCFLKAQQVAAGDQQISPWSASAPSQAASFPAITLALRAQKNWPTRPARQKFVPHGTEGFIQHRLGSQ